MLAAVRSRRCRLLVGILLIVAVAIGGLGHSGATTGSRGAGAEATGSGLAGLATPPPLPLGAGLDLPPPITTTSPSPEPSTPASGIVDGPAGIIADAPVVNASHGAIDDLGARQLAAAYLASVAWTVRSVEQRDATVLDILFPAGNRDTSTATLIANLRAAGATAVYQAGHTPHVTRLLLVALTATQQAQIAGDAGVVAGPLALVVTYQGPVDITVDWPDASPQTYTVVPEGREIMEVSVGGVIDDPRLGRVWRESYSRDCTAHPDPALCP